MGACVQCSFGRCANAFHVECGRSLYDPDQGTWLCPSHKASKLTREVRLRHETCCAGFKEVADEVWKVVIGAREPCKRKYVKTGKAKSKAKAEKTKIVVELKAGSALLKVYKNGKLAKVMKYVEDKKPSLSDPGKPCKSCIKLSSLALFKDLKRPRGAEACLEAANDDLSIKMILPQLLLSPAGLKKPKLFS